MKKKKERCVKNDAQCFKFDTFDGSEELCFLERVPHELNIFGKEESRMK